MSDVLLPTPVLLLEDDPPAQVRMRGILCSLGYSDQEILTAASLAEARALLKDQLVSLALIDMGLPDGHGVDLIQELRESDAALPILVVSTWGSAETVVGALQAGATGYLLKEADDIEVVMSIRSVLRGGAPIDPRIATHILAIALKYSPAPVTEPHVSSAHLESEQTLLSPRQREVLELVSKGLTNREIAALIGVSPHTVVIHIKHVYTKLAVTSTKPGPKG